MNKLTIVGTTRFENTPISDFRVYFDLTHFLVVTMVALTSWTNFNRCVPSYSSVLLLFWSGAEFNQFVLLHSGHEFYDFSYICTRK